MDLGQDPCGLRNQSNVVGICASEELEQLRCNFKLTISLHPTKNRPETLRDEVCDDFIGLRLVEVA